MKETRIAATSDLHGALDFTVPRCDVLTISGDICPVTGSHSPERQESWLRGVFFPWCIRLMADGVAGRVVFTPGNHDFVCQRRRSAVESMLPDGVSMLIDSRIELDGLVFYGTPWVPRFGNWAFMEEDEQLVSTFGLIPEGVHVLITHGPAYGVNDTVAGTPWRPGDDGHLGSRSLRDAIVRAAPRWHLCGHIHTGSHHPAQIGGTQSVNVSLMDEEYRKAFDVFEFSIFREEEL